jgi:hypothetical protein
LEYIIDEDRYHDATVREQMLHHRLGHSIAPCAALVLALGALALAGCQEQGENREVLLLVDDLNQAIEERDTRGLLRHTTTDFLLFPGRLDRTATAKRAFLMFKLKGAVEALYPTPEIELDGDDRARVSGHFLLVRRGVSDQILEDLEHDPQAWLERASEIGEVIGAEISLVREGETWLVQTARFF